MRLGDLAGIDSDSEVTGFALDHRKVARGSVFGAFKGQVFNGEDFVAEAVERGAVAVVARPEAPVAAVPHLIDPERLQSMWPTMIAGPRSPGVGAPENHPAGNAPGGTSSEPSSWSPSSSRVFPTATAAARLASATPVVLDTNGTVREARGFTSST